MAEAWSDAEVRATVADYLDMLRAEVAGEPYSKAKHRAELRTRLIARTDAAVEFKHQNISAVLDERGCGGFRISARQELPAKPRA